MNIHTYTKIQTMMMTWGLLKIITRLMKRQKTMTLKKTPPRQLMT